MSWKAKDEPIIYLKKFWLHESVISSKCAKTSTGGHHGKKTGMEYAVSSMLLLLYSLRKMGWRSGLAKSASSDSRRYFFSAGLLLTLRKEKQTTRKFRSTLPKFKRSLLNYMLRNVWFRWVWLVLQNGSGWTDCVRKATGVESSKEQIYFSGLLQCWWLL